MDNNYYNAYFADKIGERLFDSLFLFSEVLTFEKAKEFRNNYKPHQVVYATW